MSAEKKSKRYKSIALGIAKYGVAFGLLYLAVQKADLSKILESVSHIGIFHFMFALLFLALAQGASALRMQYYLRTKGTVISYIYSVKLYYVGMLYNNILPGGIGGDGYKVLILNRNNDIKLKRVVQVMLSDRANGLLALLALLYSLMAFSNISANFPYGNLIYYALMLLTIPIYSAASWLFMGEKPRESVRALLFSVMVQILSLLAAIVIMHGVRIDFYDTFQFVNTLTVYLIASILSAVLPISMGGVGIRELTFVYAGKFIDIDVDKAIAFSVGYFVIYFATSLIGLAFLNSFKREKQSPESPAD